MAEELPNARIPDLPPLATLMPGGLVPLYDPVQGLTGSFDLSLLLPSASTDYRWSSTTDYDLGALVTHNGKIWESLDDNNQGNIPMDGSLFWEERSKATSGLYTAGIYTDDEVMVYTQLDGFYQFFRLASATRPYNSTDFIDELAAGDWELASERQYLIIEQVAHGLDEDTVVTHDGGEWIPWTDGFQKLAIVKNVIDADHAVLALTGAYLKGFSGLTPSDTYYVQPDATIDNIATDDALFVAISATEAVLLASGGGGGGGSAWGAITGTITDQTDLVSYVAAQIAAAVAGLLDLRGSFDASGGAYPSSGGSGTAGAILKADAWIITVAGTLPTGQAVQAGDVIFALIDTPGNTQANWARIENNLTYTPVNRAGDTMSGNLAMGGNKVTGLGAASSNGEAVRFEQLPVKAITSEINTGTDDAKFLTSLSLQGSKYETQYGLRTFAASTTAANTYTADLSPAITTYGSGGLLVKIKFTNANTGAATINLNSLGAKSMIHTDGSALISGDIPAGGTALLQYNGTDFILINPINIVLSAVTASKIAWWDANKKLTFIDYATQSEAVTGSDNTKPITPLALEKKRSITLTSFSNSATGSSTIDCDSKQEVTVYYNTTVTGAITIALSNDSNLQYLHVVIPITGSNIAITTPSTTRMSRSNEVSSGDGWYQSTKILQVSSGGTADTHELSFKRVSAGPTFNLMYDGPFRA